MERRTKWPILWPFGDGLNSLNEDNMAHRQGQWMSSRTKVGHEDMASDMEKAMGKMTIGVLKSHIYWSWP